MEDRSLEMECPAGTRKTRNVYWQQTLHYENITEPK